MKMLEIHHDNPLVKTIVDGLYKKIVPVNVTNIANWYFEEHEGWGETTSDYPDLSPPWEKAWYEYKLPRTMRIGKDVYKAVEDGVTVYLGFYIECHKLNPDHTLKIIEEDPTTNVVKDILGVIPDIQDIKKRKQGLLDLYERGERIKYTFSCLIYSSVENNLRISMSVSDYITTNGKLLSSLEKDYGLLLMCPIDKKILKTAKDVIDMSSYVHPVFFAISLLHCRNVETIDIDIPEKVKKKREKTGKFTGVRYKTLVVHPSDTKKRIVRHGNKRVEQTTVPLHMRRGHWKDYRQGKGLFGKWKGLYWWNQEERGSEEQGIIYKDIKMER